MAFPSISLVAYNREIEDLHRDLIKQLSGTGFKNAQTRAIRKALNTMQPKIKAATPKDRGEMIKSARATQFPKSLTPGVVIGVIGYISKPGKVSIQQIRAVEQARYKSDRKANNALLRIFNSGGRDEILRVYRENIGKEVTAELAKIALKNSKKTR